MLIAISSYEKRRLPLFAYKGEHMSKITNLSPLSKISTAAFVLLSSLLLQAQPHYSMTVVKEARVSKEKSQPAQGPLACKNVESSSLGVDKMGWNYSTVGVKLADVGKTAAVFATRTNDERLIDTLTLWLAVKSKSGVKYYGLSDIDTDGSDVLPKISVQNNLLIIEADTLSADAANPDIIKAPDQYGQLYQTIRLGEMTEKGLQLSILNCTR